MNSVPTASTTIWFNKGLRSTFNFVGDIRNAQQAGENFRIIVTHTSASFPAKAVADHFEVEPAEPDDYIQWCLDFCKRHDVKVFFPGRQASAIAAAASRFDEAGVKVVLVGSPATLELLENKGAFYRSLPPGLVPLPEYRVVNNLKQFETAYAELRKKHPSVCFKPAVGIYASGFRILVEDGNSVDRLLFGDPIEMLVDDAKSIFAKKLVFKDVLVMEVLPGVERSVDCLAVNGELVGAVVRSKVNGYEEVLEDNPTLVEYARLLTKHAQLNGLFNAQFKDSANGTPCLLEINGRLAGGTYIGTPTGLVLPYWAIRLALGTATAAQVPTPRTGIRVGGASSVVILPNS